jgi:indolepyruvate ferredoxin oxidoreductase beta subunit
VLNCVIAGIGGQGTVLASRLIGIAALDGGFDARGSETIGMAQRGGSVVSHIRVGKDIFSPLIPQGKADVIIAFEPGEAVRAAPFLSRDGVMIASDRGVPPVSGAEHYDVEAVRRYIKVNFTRVYLLDGEELITRCGGAKFMNVALLGAASETGVFPFPAQAIEKAIATRINAKFMDANINALRVGAEMIKDYV